MFIHGFCPLGKYNSSSLLWQLAVVAIKFGVNFDKLYLKY